jgi:two-component system, NarL family, response regulator EvgA
MSLKILSVDDHPVIMMGIKVLLEADDFAHVIECGDYRQIGMLIEKHAPDAVLIDMHMPRFDLERDFRQIKKKHPNEIYIAYSADEDLGVIERCRDLGFRGYILKTTDFSATRREIAAIMEGQQIFPDLKSQPLKTLVPFSDSQMEILRLLASGHKNKEIAAILGIQDVTVDYHKRKIKDALAAQTSAEAVALAKANGWI